MKLLATFAADCRRHYRRGTLYATEARSLVYAALSRRHGDESVSRHVIHIKPVLDRVEDAERLAVGLDRPEPKERTLWQVGT